MKVFQWAAANDGCRFYRLEMPAEALRARGHEVKVAQHWVKAWHDADVLVGQRVGMPGPSQLWRQRTDLFRVFEMDDDLLNLEPRNPAYGVYREELIRERLMTDMRTADRIVVSTNYLADQVAQYNQDVVVVPNTVPAELLDRERPQRDVLTIGWAGSPTHDADWHATTYDIGRFLKRNRQVAFHCIGAGYGYHWELGDRFRHTPWFDTVPEYWRALDFDIGIAPLVDHPFNRSKSHIKALEYGALGIPVIASDVGPYREYVEHGVNGFLVKRSHEWGKYLHVLTNDHALRQEMGKQARVKAGAYTTDRWVGAWERAYGIGGLVPPVRLRRP